MAYNMHKASSKKMIIWRFLDPIPLQIFLIITPYKISVMNLLYKYIVIYVRTNVLSI